MKLNLFILILFSVNYVTCQIVRCDYKTHSDEYSCDLTIRKSTSALEVSGEHLSGYSDDDVHIVRKDNTTAHNWNIFPSIICDKFKNLKKIDLQSMAFERIYESSIEKCENLRELDLGGNKIKNLPKNVFTKNQKLRKLWLNYNKIEELPDGIFDSLIHLEILHLSHNSIKTLNPNLFSNLKNLRTLALSKNELRDLPANAFTNLINLEEIWLGDNNLTTIHSDSFAIHPNFKKISINRNQLIAFDERIIEKCEALKIIHVKLNPCVVEGNDTISTLKVCFDNYKNRETLADRVDHMEVRINEFNQKSDEFLVYLIIFGVAIVITMIFNVFLITIIFCIRHKVKRSKILRMQIDKNRPYMPEPQNIKRNSNYIVANQQADEEREPKYEIIREPIELPIDESGYMKPKSFDQPSYFH